MLFFAGVIAVSAIVLPGMSGSLLLLVLGQYEYLSTALSGFTDALGAALQSGGVGSVYQTGIPVVPFPLGAVVDLLSVAHAVRAAFSRNREVTVVFLVSLVFGALRAPVEQASVELERTGLGTGSDRSLCSQLRASLSSSSNGPRRGRPLRIGYGPSGREMSYYRAV